MCWVTIPDDPEKLASEIQDMMLKMQTLQSTISEAESAAASPAAAGTGNALTAPTAGPTAGSITPSPAGTAAAATETKTPDEIQSGIDRAIRMISQGTTGLAVMTFTASCLECYLLLQC